MQIPEDFRARRLKRLQKMQRDEPGAAQFLPLAGIPTGPP